MVNLLTNFRQSAVNVVLSGCCRPDPIMVFLQPAEQTHP